MGTFAALAGSELANAANNTNITTIHHYWSGTYAQVDNEMINTSSNNGGGIAVFKSVTPNVPFLSRREQETGVLRLPRTARTRLVLNSVLYNVVQPRSGNRVSGTIPPGDPAATSISGLPRAIILWRSGTLCRLTGILAATPKPVTMAAPNTTNGYAMGNGTFLAVYVRTLTSSPTSLHGATVTQGNPSAGISFTVNVPAAGMTAQWINPVNATVVGSPFTPGTGAQQFTVPSMPNDPSNGHPPQDALLVISATSSAPPPSACDVNVDACGSDGCQYGDQPGAGIVCLPSASLSGGTGCTVVGVQRVVNAMLGGTCRVGP